MPIHYDPLMAVPRRPVLCFGRRRRKYPRVVTFARNCLFIFGVSLHPLVAHRSGRLLSGGYGAPRRRRLIPTGTFIDQGRYRGPEACARCASSTAKPAAGHISSGSGVIAIGSTVEHADLPRAPSRAQLKTLFMHSAVPMVGFGEAFDGLVLLEIYWNVVFLVDVSCLRSSGFVVGLLVLCRQSALDSITAG